MKFNFLGPALLLSICCSAQVLPADKAQLHYTSLCFQEKAVEGANFYRLAVYTDSVSAVRQKPAFTHTAGIPVFKVKDLGWGKKYWWSVFSAAKRKGRETAGDLHSFTILPRVNSPLVTDIRIDVLTNDSSKHAGGFVTIDYAKAVCSREGKTLWTVPPIPSVHAPASQIRDLRMTRENTFTFLSDNQPFEMDYWGEVLWKLPHPFVYVGSSRVDLQACKLEYSIVSPK